MNNFKLKEILFIVVLVILIYTAYKIFVAYMKFLFGISVPILIIGGVIALIVYWRKRSDFF